MEILQTIWQALTTENEVLTNVFASVMMFVELTVSMLLSITILNINVNIKQKTLYIIILSLIGIVSLWLIPAPFNTIINIIACPILVYFLFQTNIIKAILCEIIPFIFFFILSSVLMSFWVKITHLPSDYFLHIPLYKFCLSATMHLSTFLLYLVLHKFSINITLLDKMKREHNSTIFLNLIIRNSCNSHTIMYFNNLYKQHSYDYYFLKFNHLTYIFLYKYL